MDADRDALFRSHFAAEGHLAGWGGLAGGGRLGPRHQRDIQGAAGLAWAVCHPQVGTNPFKGVHALICPRSGAKIHSAAQLVQLAT